MKLSFLDVAKNQLKGAPPLAVNADLSGKTVVVVGANTGIGLEAAKHFASMNASRVILACRNEEKGKVAVAEVERHSGSKNVELWLLDLNRFSSVIDFAERFDKDGGRLDILVMNAGIVLDNYESAEGWEATLHVNHLATALCSLLLLPRLSKTGSDFSVHTRLVIVSSEVHHFTNIDETVKTSPKILEKLSDKDYCFANKTARGQYFISKLLNVLFTRALASRLSLTSPVIVTAVNPGYCASGLTRNIPDGPITTVEENGEKVPLIPRTVEEGSRQLLWASLGPPGGDETLLKGAYVSDNSISEVSDFVLSETGKEFEDRIWSETVEILSEVAPQIKTVEGQYLRI